MAIARLPVPDLLAALREDGSPPLYYLLLHGWLQVVGSGTWAVRLLSSALAMAALGLFYLLGRRHGGPVAGLTVLVLAAANPWLVRYATEARMYTLVVVLVLLLLLSLDRLLESPSPENVAWLVAASGALLLTHYWALFLLAPLAVVAGVAMCGSSYRRVGGHVLAGLAGGAVVFLPWAPSLLFQLRHTGTPWSTGPRLGDLVGSFIDWSSMHVGWATVIGALAVLGLVVLGTARPGAGRWLAGWTGATLVLAYTASALSGAAFVTRYTAVVVPLVLLLVARGIRALPARAGAATLAALTIGWLACSVTVAVTPRTQAPAIADVINALGSPGDTVAYCPDQLGPSVSRLVVTAGHQLSYPDGADPGRVDWVDYQAHQEDGSPTAFSDRLLLSTPSGARIWLVTDEDYAAAAPCPTVVRALTAALGRPVREVTADQGLWEHASLLSWLRP